MELVIKHAVSIAGTIKALAAGEVVNFPKDVVTETVVRSACTRIKNATGRRYSVNRQEDGSHNVTRIS